jgi:hypothetical protein
LSEIWGRGNPKLLTKRRFGLLKRIYAYTSNGDFQASMLVDDYEENKVTYDYLLKNDYISSMWNHQTAAYHVYMTEKGIDFVVNNKCGYR